MPTARPATADAIERLLRDGFARQQAGDAIGAEQIYRAVLADAPADHRALTLLAAILEGRGELDAAVAAYRKAIQALPQAPAPQFQLANLMLRLGDAEAALGLARRFNKLMPNDPRGWRLRGRAAEAAGAMSEAAAGYSEALERGDAQAAGFLGKALQAIGDHAGAAAAYEKALPLAPENATLFGALGNVYSALERRSEAIACYRRAVAIDPALYEAHGSLGVELQGLGKYGEAAASYAAAIAKSPDRWEVLNNLASCWLDQGRPRRAQAGYRELIRRNPG